MQVLFEDDRGRLVAMECTSVAAVPDPETDGGWFVVATEMGNERGVIIRTDVSKTVAWDIVTHLYTGGRYVPHSSWTDDGQVERLKMPI